MSNVPNHEVPSYLVPHGIGPWGVYLEQVGS